MPLLLLTENDVSRLLKMPEAIEVMEEAFGQLAAGLAMNVPRERARAPGIVLHSMSAAAEYLGLVGWKQYTTTARGARFHVGLYDQDSGELVALIEANRLGQMRTGAVSGLAAKYLAVPTARAVGLFGSGWQAESQLAAIHAVCPLERAWVYSRDATRREKFAARMSAELRLEVLPAEEPRQAVAGLPIVVTATTSRQPVFDGSWLEPGALVCAIGSNWREKAEIDVTTVSRASDIVCDSVACCQHEAGDFTQPFEQGKFTWDQATELADVVTGKTTGRTNLDSIVVFKSVGMAIEDVALAGRLMKKLAPSRYPRG